MSRALLVVIVLGGLAGCSRDNGTGPLPTASPIVVAFGSSRPPSTIVGSDLYVWRGGDPEPFPNLNTPAFEGPCALSADGRTLAFGSTRSLVGAVASMLLYDVPTASITVPQSLLPLLASFNPSLSGDGRYLAVSYMLSNDPFDQYVTIVDIAADTLLPVPTLNDPNGANIDPWLNGDGSLVAFASNGALSLGAFDIMLYSVPGDSIVPLPGLNSAANEHSASISHDGRYVAFQSGRPGGVGLIDVYVYDRQTATLLDLPGANTTLSEYQPSISPDGRWLAYVTDATGGGDVRVYDLETRRLIELPGLNDPYHADQFPVVITTPAP
jgi:Tol biopolymer transport system component